MLTLEAPLRSQHTRSHPHFAQLGIHEPQARGGSHPFIPIYTFKTPFSTLGSHSLRTEVTGHTDNALLRKSATGAKHPDTKSSPVLQPCLVWGDFIPKMWEEALKGRELCKERGAEGETEE